MKITILMGLPLSGKSTWILEQKFNKDTVVISADYIKTCHEDYDPSNSYLLHEWSIEKAKKLLFVSASQKLDIVFDSGSINNNYTKNIISELKLLNYSIKIVHIKTNYKICLERNKKRKRKIPESNIIYKAIRENSQAFKLKEIVDNFVTIEHFTNRNLFVDMDGVIAAMTTLPIIDGTIDFVNAEVHKYLYPVDPIIQKLHYLENNGFNIFILSAIPNSFSFNEKNEWLNKFFNIPKENRFFVNQGKHKAQMLENLIIKLKLDKKDTTLIDDTHSILYDVEERGIKAMHPSEFLIYKFI